MPKKVGRATMPPQYLTMWARDRVNIMSEVFRGRHCVYVEMTGLNSSVKFVFNVLIVVVSGQQLKACKNWPSECKMISSFFLYHILIIIYTTTTKFSSLLWNLMGFLLHFTETGYYILNGRYTQKYNAV